MGFRIPAWAIVVLGGACAPVHGGVITFEFFPGPDGILGTPDDVPIVAPASLAAQDVQIGDQFAPQGVLFTLPVVQDHNEIINGELFAGSAQWSPVNVLASDGEIEFRFTGFVQRVTVTGGIGEGRDHLYTFNHANQPIANSPLDGRGGVSHSQGIARVVIRPKSPRTMAVIDDLEFEFNTPSCAPDLSAGAIQGLAGYGVPDGVLDGDDFFYYLNEFVAGNLGVCDLTTGSTPGQTGYGVPNGLLTNDDFFFYLDLFALGC
ncbi:MAG: GC-type dockerin domain-anchored protein [Phycisphaerales bacterium]